MHEQPLLTLPREKAVAVGGLKRSLGDLERAGGVSAPHPDEPQDRPRRRERERIADGLRVGHGALAARERPRRIAAHPRDERSSRERYRRGIRPSRPREGG